MSWMDDPRELDRWLEGELPADQAQARAEDVAREPARQAHAQARKAWLEGLGATGRRWAETLPDALHPGVGLRVRARLAQARTEIAAGPSRGTGRRWLRVASAAVLLVGAGALVLLTTPREVTAIPPPILDAKRMLLATPAGPHLTGCDQEPTNPYLFPLVQSGELRVAACVPGEADGEGGARARLYRPEELPSVGFVAVPEPGVRPSARIGKTDLGDAIVYDVRYGSTRAYLAVRADFVKRRGDCAACHNQSREGQKNPHWIELRRW